ncbi:unnamed protein product, partial [marine sediment metagenome]
MSSYYISGLVGNPVVAVPESHSPRRVEAVDGPERRADVRMTFRGRRTSPTTPEGALNVVLKYNASYVVTPANGLTVFDRRPDLFRAVYEDSESRVERMRFCHGDFFRRAVYLRR